MQSSKKIMKKLYFTQMELSEIIGEETHTIRYWESTFPILCPKTIRNGRRVYTDKNIEFFHFVKKLIRDDKLSPAGVKEHLEIFLTNIKSNPKPETVKNEIVDEKNKDFQTEPLVTFTKEEYTELLQIIRMLVLLIKTS